ncbi:serine hydrolase domain-containing protein [Paenibacillus sp. MBLB4367]|uniref:serine hydrolase domain-containing protein n=1 Tax=Paenibacillus sp. MBLB4367 TaxID=3384767 RepID=UPI003907F0B2
MEKWKDALSYVNDYADAGYLHGSFLLAYQGAVLLQKGYGFASREHGIPNTADTRFRIGSLSKGFTAAAVLKLVEAGQLRLDDKLDTFIPDYPEGERITIHHLLTHSSGMANYTASPDFFGT